MKFSRFARVYLLPPNHKMDFLLSFFYNFQGFFELIFFKLSDKTSLIRKAHLLSDFRDPCVCVLKQLFCMNNPALCHILIKCHTCIFLNKRQKYSLEKKKRSATSLVLRLLL